MGFLPSFPREWRRYWPARDFRTNVKFPYIVAPVSPVSMLVIRRWDIPGRLGTRSTFFVQALRKFPARSALTTALFCDRIGAEAKVCCFGSAGYGYCDAEMTLYPIRDGKPLHYSMAGWRVLVGFLEDCGIELTELIGLKDGDSISAQACFRVANTIDFHWDELVGTRLWLRDQAQEWRRLAEAGGCQRRDDSSQTDRISSRRRRI